MQFREALPLLLVAIAQAERKSLFGNRRPSYTFSEGLTTKLDTAQWSSCSATSRSLSPNVPIRLPSGALASHLKEKVTTSNAGGTAVAGRRGEQTGGTIYASLRQRSRPTAATQEILVEEKEPPTASDEEFKDEEQQQVPHDVLENVGKAFVPTSIWQRLTGQEFDHPKAIDDLVETGLNLAQQESNDWIKWTTKDKVDDKEAALDAGDIVVYMGRCKDEEKDNLYGSNLPVVKSESIIDMTPEQMSDLLLDSSKVKTYNKYSVGRTDVRRIEGPTGTTKIVRNITKPPVSQKKVMVTTMLHSRQLENGSYIVVSRAVPPVADEDTSNEEYGRSEILLGVNLLEPCNGEKSSRVTSITHVYSQDLPNMIASRVAVKSAVNFVKDLRAVCDEPSS